MAPKTPSDFAKVPAATAAGPGSVHRFLASQWLERGLSEASQNAYGYELAKLLAHLADTPLEQATEVELREYLLAMHQRGVRAAAVRRATVVFRRYYAWLCREGLRPSNPAIQLEVRKAAAKPAALLGSQGLAQVMKCVAQAPAREQLRDKALVSLAIGAGLRVGELLALKPTHLDLSRQELVLFGRDGRRRSVNLAPAVLEAVRAYVDEGRPGYLRADKPTDKLFLTRLGSGMTASGMWKHLQALAERAGISPSALTVEALRQAKATRQVAE